MSAAIARRGVPVLPGRPLFPDRTAIEAAIEHLIAALDVLDGDPDLEDDDPSFDPADEGEEDFTEGRDLPRYGIDQTAGPTNLREAENNWDRHVRENPMAPLWMTASAQRAEAEAGGWW